MTVVVVVVCNTSLECNVVLSATKGTGDWKSNFTWMHTLAVVLTITPMSLGIVGSSIALLVYTAAKVRTMIMIVRKFTEPTLKCMSYSPMNIIQITSDPQMRRDQDQVVLQ